MPRFSDFSGDLEHAVDANAGDEERISLSFNLMFPDFAQRLSRPLWSPADERKPIAEPRG